MPVTAKPTAEQIPPYVSEQRLSELIGIPLPTLRTRRSREPEKNPPYIRLGNRILYKWSEVEEWMEKFAVREGA